MPSKRKNMLLFEGSFLMFSCAKKSTVHCGRVDAFLEFFLLGSESWLVVTTSSLLPEKTKTTYSAEQEN